MDVQNYDTRRATGAVNKNSMVLIYSLDEDMESDDNYQTPRGKKMALGPKAKKKSELTRGDG